MDYRQDLEFGLFLNPDASAVSQLLELAALADDNGLDVVSTHDHPYQSTGLDSWTVLSVIATRTKTVRVLPNLVCLPLRSPAILARSTATLDILSSGRVDLGLGAGALWKAIVAAGGPNLSPGQSIERLAEAIDIIRALWRPDGPPLEFEGEGYQYIGLPPGPAPAHHIPIYLGAYKPRLLGLTGRVADGWLPSLGFGDLGDLMREGNARIDEAATEAGRDPAHIRRLCNINGSFGTAAGFLEGTPADWAEQLATLTLTHGTSTYLLQAANTEMARIFASEVAPEVKRQVTAERESGQHNTRCDLGEIGANRSESLMSLVKDAPA